MERISEIFERYFVPPLGAIASSIYLQAIRDAFIIFTLPLIIAGSLFLIIANPPIGALAEWLKPYQDAILVPYELSFGLMALFLAFGVAHSLAQYRRTEAVQPGILAMVVFLIANVPVTDLNELKLGQILPSLGVRVCWWLFWWVLAPQRWCTGFAIRAIPFASPRRCRQT
ncbi:hypothetical protein KSC_063450 [Ktedonobacter sp. SOSP1-52]|nr:PTS transporter subunit EIIC [Ktedonobacter sp. SOSP1-52]GHO67453.1 hypothetical protein KSC_063450 [Ktedonobacter sp. SOSP1-52]